MSRFQELIGVLRGLQILLKESVNVQEKCLQHIVKNSSLTELYKSCAKENNSQYIENASLNKLIKETFERTLAVSQGLQYLLTSPITNQEKQITSTKNDLSRLDVPSLTLRELEDLAMQNRNYVNMKNSGIQEKKITLPQNKIETEVKPPISNELHEALPNLTSIAKQRAVPSSRISRLASFGTLFAGLGAGTVSELTKGALGLGGSTNIKDAVLSPTNTSRIVDTLCKVRGAALKLGQILSLQDSTIVSPELAKAFERVRQFADYMPNSQVKNIMKREFGNDWEEKLKLFEYKPFAAASIGQVHRGIMKDGFEVAIKIQYPGVAKSIDSDIDNLVGLLKIWDLFPKGIFIDNIIKVAKRELAWEVDYIREAEYTERYKQMVSKYPQYKVPRIIREFSTKHVLTSELVPGLPLDKCFNMSYEDRHFIGKSVMELCLRELFEFQCMQTDPNWSNFLYDPVSKKLTLIDFGSTRFYSKTFIDDYLKVILAAMKNDVAKVLILLKKMGFLTGYESKIMEDANVSAVMTLGSIFKCEDGYDFEKQNITKEIAQLVPTMIAHRLCPPPEEIYSLHRKLSGVLLLNSKLKIRLDCRSIFEEITKNYVFDSS